MTTHACDLCGEREGTEIETGIFVCAGCGFVHVKERRSPRDIAADWSTVYSSGAYDPNWPGVKARLWYVAEWLDQKIGLAGKSVLDIGAGRGFFLRCVRDRDGHPVGLEPDKDNVALIKSHDIACFHGAIEDHENLGQYDLVTILWTLENCGDCLAMLRWARNHLAPGGRVVVATGSRILVPFKKPYWSYFGKLAPDLHCFRWTPNTLRSAFAKAGMVLDDINDYARNDVLLVVAKRGEPSLPAAAYRDDPAAVVSFFRQWKAQWP